jgi:hypothetical protein
MKGSGEAEMRGGYHVVSDFLHNASRPSRWWRPSTPIGRSLLSETNKQIHERPRGQQRGVATEAPQFEPMSTRGDVLSRRGGRRMAGGCSVGSMPSGRAGDESASHASPLVPLPNQQQRRNDCAVRPCPALPCLVLSCPVRFRRLLTASRRAVVASSMGDSQSPTDSDTSCPRRGYELRVTSYETRCDKGLGFTMGANLRDSNQRNSCCRKIT